MLTPSRRARAPSLRRAPSAVSRAQASSARSGRSSANAKVRRRYRGGADARGVPPRRQRASERARLTSTPRDAILVWGRTARVHPCRPVLADVQDEAEVLRLRRLALQSLDQLRSFTSNSREKRDWHLDLKPLQT